MKQLEVQIMGQSYLLGCPEGGEQRLLEAVEKVDTAMCRIRDAGKVKARDRIAVLAALNLAFDAERNASQQLLQAASFANGDATLTGKTVQLAGTLSRPQIFVPLHERFARKRDLRPRMDSSAVRIGLYISLNQCSLSAGLEHRSASVNVSRQMIPRPKLTSPT